MSGLLAVHAHPDDETISTGALLATWVRAGLPTSVVTCTRGEEGEVIPPGLKHLEGAGESFARHREAELTEALGHLGVADHVYLDAIDPTAPRIVDSGMAWVGTGRAGSADDVPDGALVAVPVAEAAQMLARLLLDRRPSVVATYEPGGGYGHPDHVRVHEVTSRAVEIAVAAGLPQPVLLWSVLEREVWHAAVTELRAAGVPDGLSVADPTAEPSAVVGEVDLRVAVRPVLPAVLGALEAHGTQVQAVDAIAGDRAAGRFALSNDVVQPITATEAYLVADGDGAAIPWPQGCTPARG